MSKITVVASLLAVIAVAVLGVVLHQGQNQLREENQALHSELTQMGRLAADNQHLSTLLAQAKTVQSSANEQFQELVKLRSEVVRLTKENNELTSTNESKTTQAVLDQLRELTGIHTDIGHLAEDIESLRDELLQVQAAGVTTSPTPTATDQSQTTATPNASASPQAPVAIRMIETHADTFADKLKRSVSAQDSETFPEVFGRFLQVNGVDTSSVVGAYYDERTGRLIVRAPQNTLDAIEKVTLGLDQSR
jgi:chromosome segregation ATPase